MLVLVAESAEEKYNCSGLGILTTPSPDSNTEMWSRLSPSGFPGLADTLLASGTQET